MLVKLFAMSTPRIRALAKNLIVLLSIQLAVNVFAKSASVTQVLGPCHLYDRP